MNLPAIYLSQTGFEALPITRSGEFLQDRCRYLSKCNQWILIDRNDKEVPCAVIKISEKTPSGFVVTHDFSNEELALEHARAFMSSDKTIKEQQEEALAQEKEEYYQKYIKPKHSRADHGRAMQQAKARKKRRRK